MSIIDLLASNTFTTVVGAVTFCFVVLCLLSIIVTMMNAMKDRYDTQTKMTHEAFKVEHADDLVKVLQAEKEKLEADANNTNANTAFIKYATENHIDIEIARNSLNSDDGQDWLKNSYEGSDDPNT